MPEKETIRRARRDAQQGKSPSTQAGEFIREEVHHIREGVHGARSAKQAIAIGLSKARRAGVALPLSPKSNVASSQAKHGTLTTKRSNGSAGTRGAKRASSARAALEALRDEPRAAASHKALARHATQSASARGTANLRAAAEKAVATKGRTGLRAAAKKATATRRRGR